MKSLKYILLILTVHISLISSDSECVTYDFEEDFDSTMVEGVGICANNMASGWTRNSYTSTDVEPFHERSNYFISPESGFACITSTPFAVEAGGVFEVNIHIIEPTGVTLQNIIVHEEGTDSTVGIIPINTVTQDGWHTLSVELIGAQSFNGYNLFFLACLLAVSGAQRLSETTNDISEQRRSGGGYGLLRPGYQGGYNNGYFPNSGYPNYGGTGLGGYPGGYGSGYPGQGGFGGINGYRPNYRPGYPGNIGGYPGNIGYPGNNVGYPGNNAGYPGGNIGYPAFRPGYNQYRPGYDRPYPGNQGNYFGGYGDGYNDNFRLLGRKAGEEKKRVDTVVATGAAN